MAENYVPNLGHLCGEDARRDAVHIALAPVEAGQLLTRGQRVGVREGKAYALIGTIHGEIECVGIVDPFLPDDLIFVHTGSKFWLLLLPGTITGLRHVWNHPAFTIKVPEVK